MTKKDYENITREIKNALDNPSHYFLNPTMTEHQNGVLSVAVALANHVLSENPRFDKNRCFKACGMSEEK